MEIRFLRHLRYFLHGRTNPVLMACCRYAPRTGTSWRNRAISGPAHFDDRGNFFGVTGYLHFYYHYYYYYYYYFLYVAGCFSLVRYRVHFRMQCILRDGGNRVFIQTDPKGIHIPEGSGLNGSSAKTKWKLASEEMNEKRRRSDSKWKWMKKKTKEWLDIYEGGRHVSNTVGWLQRYACRRGRPWDSSPKPSSSSSPLSLHTNFLGSWTVDLLFIGETLVCLFSSCVTSCYSDKCLFPANGGTTLFSCIS